MNYEQFKQKVLDEFIGNLDPEFSGYVLRVNEIRKNNEKLTGVSVAPEDPSDIFAAPTFYIESMYKEYQNCGNFSLVISNTARIISNALKGAKPQVPAFTARSLLDNVVLQLISVRGNEEYIRNLPHRYFLDMAVIYRRIVSVDDHGVMSFVIDNYLAEHADLTEDMLFDKAYSNTRVLFTPQCRDMRSILSDMTPEYPEANRRHEDDPTIMVITNDHKYLAATAMLYPDVFESIAKQLDSDLVILPSSVHDLIVLADEDEFDSDMLLRMVDDVNCHNVSRTEILSFNVYGYKKGDMEVTYYTDLVEKEAV